MNGSRTKSVAKPVVKTFARLVGICAVLMATAWSARATDWTPAEITTEMWFDADDYSTITEASGAVSEWRDKSGNDRHLSQTAFPVAQPVYDATGWSGGKPTLAFDTYNAATRASTLYRDATSDGMPATGYTLFTVIDPRSIDTESWLTCFRNTDGKEHRFQINNNGFVVRSDASNGGSASAAYSTGEKILMMTLDSDVSEIRENGVQTAGNNGTYTPAAITGTFALSSRGGTDGHAGMDADLSEYILVSGAPDQETREKIEGYLAWKWGLEGSLDASHPYKAAAPASDFWTPADTTTVLWLDASDAATITQAGGTVSQWNDKSGNNYHATQGTAADQPFYTASDSILGGMPSIGTGGDYDNVWVNVPSTTAQRTYMLAYFGDGTTTPTTEHSATLSSRARVATVPTGSRAGPTAQTGTLATISTMPGHTGMAAQHPPMSCCPCPGPSGSLTLRSRGPRRASCS